MPARSILLLVALLTSFPADAGLRCGVSRIDISPTTLPAIRNGGFTEAQVDRVQDPLYARALVLDNGENRIAMVVVDSCAVPRTLCDAARALASKATGLRPDRILISATHTHSAPSVAGFSLGCRADPAYTPTLAPKIAEAIRRAAGDMIPAKAGWAIVDAGEFTANRRWILRSDKTRKDPFGEATVRANMHPGHLHPDFVGPSGRDDPWLSFLAIKDADDRPLALLANFSMHYFGGRSGFSADYFGRYAEGLKARLPEPNERFVGMMSQGTSGDLYWADYAKPARRVSIDEYAAALLDLTVKAWEGIEFHGDLPLVMAEKRITIGRRLPSPDRLVWARAILEGMGDKRPRNHQEVYAEQAVYIDENPQEEVVLQALRIGSLGITGIPNEVYALTGLKLKAQSPLQPTFNIELANGAAGYIPPLEQHALGGYTTWPARSAGLSQEAESVIGDEVLKLLEEVAGTPRLTYREKESDYARRVLADKPIAYWRLGEMTGDLAIDASGHENHAVYSGRVAYHLPGPDSAAFGGSHDSHAVHLAGGSVQQSQPASLTKYSLELWFWNGFPHHVRPVTGTLYSWGGDLLQIAGHRTSPNGCLQFGSLTGPTPIRKHAWHHVVVVRETQQVRVYLNGDPEPEISGAFPARLETVDVAFRLGSDANDGNGLEGRLDEVALYDRPLSAAEVQAHFKVSGVPLPPRPKPASALAKRPATATWDRYAKAVLSSKPRGYWPLLATEGRRTPNRVAEGQPAVLEGESGPLARGDLSPNLLNGRVVVDPMPLGDHYSVEFWFRNDLPNESRPVTGYLFSRGPDGHTDCPGDHLGIGGTAGTPGHLFLFNGNKRYEDVIGVTRIPEQTWNHVVLARDGETVRLFLNGSTEAEFAGKLIPTYPSKKAPIFFGGRNDQFAPFRGMMDHLAIYDRPLTAKEAQAHYAASAVPPPSRKPKQTTRSELVPMSVEASMAVTRVPEGFELKLVAAEPLVQDPVAVDWGPDGKLWVAEMADYPYGMDGKGQPGGRVRFLTDANDDGRYEHSTLFLDGLNFPTSVMAWDNGVLIAAAPDILYAEDTDGDGKADKREVLFHGFIQGNQQLRVNSLRWGLDNWVYAASGGHHAGFGKATRIESRRAGTSIALGSRDFRFRPDEGLLDPQSGPAQFGRVRDDWGNWFGVQNSFPLWHYVLQDHYLRRNPDVPAPDPRRQLRAQPNPRVYPNKRPQKRFHSFDQSGRFTSGCGPGIYRDDLLFPRGTQRHAFTCEPFHNLVQHHVFEPDGVSFKAERAATDGPLDFFASGDRWSRPVMARTGPDGALWVVDMYRYMIEHPDWLPPAGKRELLPYYRTGEGYGRIYRIVSRERPARTIPRLGEKPESWVEFLASPNGLVRDMAHRLLVRSSKKDPEEKLSGWLRFHSEPEVRLQALCVLDGMGLLSTDLLEKAFDDAHAAVREHAIRIAESRVESSPALLASVLKLVEDPDPKVRLQLACSMGEWKTAEAGRALVQLAKVNDRDVHMKAAILSSATPHYEALARALVRHDGYAPDLMRMAVAHGKRREQMMDILVPEGEVLVDVDSLRRYGAWLDALSRQNLSLDEMRESSSVPMKQAVGRWESMIQSVRESVARDATPLPDRQAGIRLLGREPLHAQADRKLLARLSMPQQEPALQQTALQRMIQWGHRDVIRDLFSGWRRYSPENRSLLIGDLLRTKRGTLELLDQMEAGVISTVDLAPAQQQPLLNHADKALAKRASKVLQTAQRPERTALVNHYQAALALKGKVAEGRRQFRQRCTACHVLEGQGKAIGPDLRALTDRKPESLLVAILDPNRNVEPRYLGYQVTLTSDETFYGVIVSETGNSVILGLLDGTQRRVLRRSIQSLEAARLSFMPDGLEAGMSTQDMADLLAYLASVLDPTP